MASNGWTPAPGSSDPHHAWIAAARQQFECARVVDPRGLQRRIGNAADVQRVDLRLPADVTPGYELVEKIHQGGQGVVYRAVQRSTGRSVAVKLMHAGPLASEHERARFEREVQVLARLEHPNIVGIVDSGIAAGHAYFVMDYIDGAPLDTHLRTNAAGPPQIARLFACICEAVSEAHVRGIIHRDLKPSNVRVDARGQPHVLDFGLAKLVEPSGGPSRSTDDSGPEQAMTMTGQFVGSLPWASPEQAAGRSDEVDIRTDVYSLGVMLYHALTARFPYAVTGRLAEVLQRIERDQPVRPRAVNRRIDSELETIVLLCLAKEPARRYQSAGELARDLRHYLAGEPLEARRDSTLYVLRKVVGRHRLAAAAAAAIFALTAGSAIATTVLYRGQVRERQNAVAARDRAEREAAKSAAMVEFLQTMLASADPAQAGREVRVVDVLQRAAATLGERFGTQPEVEAALRDTIGQTYVELGLYAEGERQLRGAIELWRRVKGPESADAVQAMNNLVVTLWMQGQLAEAEALIRSVLDVRRRTLESDNLETLKTLNDLGSVLQSSGRADEALAIARQVLEISQRVLGPDDFHTIDAINSLAFRLDARGDLDEAEPLYRRVLAARSRETHELDPKTTTVMSNLANLLRTRAVVARKGGDAGEEEIAGWVHEAQLLAQEVLTARQRLFPPEHPLTGDAWQILGRVAMAGGKYADAVPLFREAVAIHCAALPEGSWRTAITARDLGECLVRMERYDEAQEPLESAYAMLADRPDAPQPQFKAIVESLVRLAELRGRADEAALWRGRVPDAAPGERR